MHLNLRQQKLFDAAANGVANRVQELVGPTAPVNSFDAAGQTPLFDAAKAGHLECVRVLILLGADVAHRDRQGRTPLHAAAAAGQPGTVELLLSAGADPELTDTNGQRAEDNTSQEVRACIFAAKARRQLDKTLSSPGALP